MNQKNPINSKIVNYIRLLRPKHYIKNLLIFVPLFFSGDFFTIKFYNALIGFFAFCCICSFVYIFNDIKDVEKDKKHPTKCIRPIASGQVSKKEAIIIALLLLIISIILLYIFESDIFTYAYILIYLLINIGYSLGIKNIPVWDVFILSAGFLLRIILGGNICSIPVSAWLYMTVIAFSFYFGLGKRRNELRDIGSSQTRKVMEYYSMNFLDKNMYMCLSIGLVFYSLWALERLDSLVWTIPIVLLICMKYNLILESSSDGDPVSTLLTSPTLLVLVIAYLGIISIGIYM